MYGDIKSKFLDDTTTLSSITVFLAFHNIVNSFFNNICIEYVKGYGKSQMVKENYLEKKYLYINNLDYWDYRNIKTSYKNNLIIKICENHNNFNQTCTEKSVILTQSVKQLIL